MFFCGVIFNEEIQDKSLIEDLLSMMQKYRADYTNTFRVLTFDSGITEFAQWHELKFTGNLSTKRKPLLYPLHAKSS